MTLIGVRLDASACLTLKTVAVAHPQQLRAAHPRR